MKNIIKLFIIVMLTTTVVDAFTQPPPMPSNFKELTLKAFLQGLYINGSSMNQCKITGGVTTKWGGTIVDSLTIELHDAVNYATVIYSSASGGKLIELNQNGSINSAGKAFVEIPNIYTGSYYITIKSRNHVETTTASPVSFSNKTITYDFTTAASQAYQNNQKFLETGVYGIYQGDVNKSGTNGAIEPLSDYASVKTAIDSAPNDYQAADLNGDGVVEPLTDYAAVKAAIDQAIGAKLP